MCYFNLDFDMCYYYIENLNTNTISNKLYIAYILISSDMTHDLYQSL